MVFDRLGIISRKHLIVSISFEERFAIVFFKIEGANNSKYTKKSSQQANDLEIKNFDKILNAIEI